MRVLIVDDEEGIREILRRWLDAAGHSTSEARDATEAIALVDAGNIDLVFADLQMPGPDGVWLVQQLRARHPHVAIILATADTQVSPIISLQAGVVAYVVKPFEADAVLAAVAEAAAWRAHQGDAAAPAGADPISDWLDRTKGLRAVEKPGRPANGR